MEIELKDGTRIPVRGVRPADAGALRQLVARASARSVAMRFFGPLKELPDGQARRFAEVDGQDRFALVALDPVVDGQIVGVVRYDREGRSGTAEYAALVEDRFQGRGLGSGLTRALIHTARENGVERLHALVLRENRSMLHLLRSLDLPGRRRREDGAEMVEVDLRSGATP